MAAESVRVSAQQQRAAPFVDVGPPTDGDLGPQQAVSLGASGPMLQRAQVGGEIEHYVSAFLTSTCR